jgi:LacI family transcriptional regulator
MNRIMKMPQQKKRITIHDIAAASGFTASTVSRALQKDERISDATRILIESFAEQMNYRSNAVASSLRTGRSKMIGVVIPLFNRTFFASIIGGIETVMKQAGYSVMICQSNDEYESEKEAIRALMQARVDGIAISVAAQTSNFDHIQLIKNEQIPLILFDRTCAEMEGHQVIIDDFKGAKDATLHLLEQGCRKIAYFAGLQHLSTQKNRTLGYKAALAEKGIPFDDNLMIISHLKEGSGDHAVNLLYEKGIEFDGIFAASDYSAVAAMRNLQKRGVEIPKSVAIVGFSDEPFTALVTPALSTVNQHTNLMGQAVADLFMNLFQHKAQPKLVNKIILEPELIIRASSLKK